MKYRYCIYLIFFITFNLFGEKKNELELKKQNIEKEIKENIELLNIIKENTKESFNKIQLLNRNIDLRNQLIKAINEELNILELKEKTLGIEIENLKNNKNKLKYDYKRFLLYQYIYLKNYKRELYLLTSENFNKAYKRFIFLKRINDSRKNKIREIKIIINELNNKKIEINNIIKENKKNKIREIKIIINELNNKKIEINNIIKEKNELLLKKNKEKNEIEININKTKTLISEYKRKEKEVKKKIEELKKNSKKIEDEIKALIKLEIKNIKFINFNENDIKGRISWPVKYGTIIEEFGEKRHPVYNNIIINNNGINISTRCNETVYCVYDGEVSKIISIKGANFAVIIKHDGFYTVYQNITKLYVLSGQKIKKNEKIGLTYCLEEENVTNIHFEIWKGTEKVNPMDWLEKK